MAATDAELELAFYEKFLFGRGIEPYPVQEQAIGPIFAGMSVLVSVALSFAPANGVQFSVTSFVICVVGGLGRPLGAMLGGLLVGLIESFTGTFITQAYTPATVSLLLIGFLLVRPAGLFGRAAR